LDDLDLPLPSAEASLAAAKAALRADMRRKLAGLDPETRSLLSRRLLARLTALPAWDAARRVLLFAPLPSEPDLDFLWTDGALTGKECAYPRMDATGLHLYAVDRLEDLQPARWGLREPPTDPLRRVLPLDLDLILTPGLAFSSAGDRLGRGGGFYDRLLADEKIRALKIGLGFSFQRLPVLPMADHDAKVDLLITD
jgi:5-formyltetrahydrofolate cyclo-ligase